ncbi:MAG: hypothetical protein COA96_03805 [SAR86 cluster bacterium]|uniref:Uncharacterized protein n=1 Tax=SAR86 cluster bacterium TaxID=2030880 RepID=A0A2A5B707_9GAMM|nr:MAG: hypothetical protein COA96_03805 [SAR86 cluster bacterium]
MLKRSTSPRFLSLLTVVLALSACSSISIPYKAYLGDPRQDMQLATVEGASFSRLEYINRYIDTVRFMTVDDIPISNSDRHESIQITPGFHELRVYFSWDMGSQRGLAPAMVDYARTRDHISRTLRFNARAGELYIVKAEPTFSARYKDITTLSHVDFWVEDQAGNEIVSKEEGRFVSVQ